MTPEPESSLFSPAEQWAHRAGVANTSRDEYVLVKCPKCAEGVLRIHHKKLWFYCWQPGTSPSLVCRADGSGEKELDALFNEKK